MMKAIRQLLNILVLIFSFIAFSQDVNYTIKEGLPSNTVYCIEQDNYGFIWFGTAAGLSRYDGYEFINYGLADGLPDMDILKFFKDSKGRIWLYTYNGKIGFVEDGKIYSSKNTPYLTGIDFDTRISSISELNEDIIISSKSSGVKVLNEDNSSHSFANTRYYHHSQATSDGWFRIFYTRRGVFIKDESAQSDSIVLYPQSIDGKGFKTKSIMWPVRYTVSKGDLIIGTSQSTQFQCVFTIDTKTFEFKYLPIEQYQIYNIKIVDDQIFLITNMGLKRFEEHSMKITDFLTSEESTDILFDIEGNQWISSLHYGVHLTYKSELERVVESDINSVERFVANDSVLFMIANESEVYGLGRHDDQQTSNNELVKQWDLPLTGQVKGLTLDSDDNIWVLLTSGLIKNRIIQDEKFLFGGGRSLLRNNTLLFANVAEVMELIDLKNGPIAQFKLSDPPYIQDFIWISANLILLINKESIQILNLQERSITDVPLLKGFGVNRVRRDSFKYLWFTTKGYGLFRLHQDSLFTYTTNELLSKRVEGTSDVISDITIYDSTLYLTIPTGLEFIRFDKTSNTIPTNINLSNGLNLGRINDVISFNNDIYVGSENGLFFLKQDSSSKVNDLSLRIDKVNTGEQISISNEANVYNYDVGQISFTVKAISYKEHNDLQYQYRINGGDWFLSSSNQIVFSDLQPDSYLVEFRARVKEGKWSTPVSYELEIIPGFWQTTWFMVLAIILTVAMSGFVAYRIFLFNSRKKQLQKEKLTSDLKALKAQINPHFLFNALNSIQNFVLENQETLAEDYLVKYGKLMRKILDHSNDLTLDLREELEYIQIYIDLERLRLIKNLDFEVVICDEIDINSTMVPSMIIQPLIENAIWHGIQPSDREGKIKLSFSLDKNMIYVEIEDNGVGFDSSVMKSSKKPHGVSLIKERIRLLNEIKKIDANLEFASNDEGTVVSFFYPINLN